MNKEDLIKFEEEIAKIFNAGKALNRQDGSSTLLVEFGDYYNEK